MVERTFRTLREVKEAYFPNRTREELEGEPTEEEIQEDLQRIIGIAKRNPEKKTSKKLPR